MVIRKVKNMAEARRFRVYVRAWRVRISDIPQGSAPAATRPRDLSISEPSGGTGARSLKGAAVSDTSTREVTVEETCRRSLSPKQFYIAETVRGVQRWRSGPIRTRIEAKLALDYRARFYIGQGYRLDAGKASHTLRSGGVVIEIRIVRDAKAVAA